MAAQRPEAPAPQNAADDSDGGSLRRRLPEGCLGLFGCLCGISRICPGDADGVEDLLPDPRRSAGLGARVGFADRAPVHAPRIRQVQAVELPRRPTVHQGRAQGDSA